MLTEHSAVRVAFSAQRSTVERVTAVRDVGRVRWSFCRIRLEFVSRIRGRPQLQPRTTFFCRRRVAYCLFVRTTREINVRRGVTRFTPGPWRKRLLCRNLRVTANVEKFSLSWSWVSKRTGALLYGDVCGIFASMFWGWINRHGWVKGVHTPAHWGHKDFFKNLFKKSYFVKWFDFLDTSRYIEQYSEKLLKY